jgi:hypothetical protein
MFGFDPGFGIDGELLYRFEQAIGVGVGYPPAKSYSEALRLIRQPSK